MPKWTILSCFPTNILKVFLISPRVLHSPCISSSLIILIMHGEACKVQHYVRLLRPDTVPTCKS